VKSARPSRRALAICAALLAGLGVVGIVRAIDDVQVEIERIEGEGWIAEGIALELGLPRDGVASRATIARLELPAQSQVLRNIRIVCPALELSAARIACADARISLSMPSVGEQELHGAITYERGTGAIEAEVRDARIAGGAARAHALLEPRGWRAQASLDRIEVAQAIELARALRPDLPEIAGSGRLSLQLDAAGGTQIERATIAAQLEDLTANNASGTLASDKLALSVRATLEASGTDRRFDVDLAANDGQAYAEPVFLDFGEHALSMRGTGRLAANGEIIAEAFTVEHSDVVRAEGSVRVDTSQPQPLRDLRLTLHALQFPGAYASYLQPFLIDTDFKSLTTRGAIAGSVLVEDGAPRRVELRFTDVGMDDGAGMFALEGLNGDLSWRDGADEDEDAVLRSGAERSTLRWQGGRLLNLALGPSTLTFTTIGRGFRLVEPTRMPLLDGALEVTSLRVRNAGLPSVAFMVDAAVQPISVAEVCRAFGWPEFGGRISGTISKLRLREGVVTLGTTLEAEVFDGRVAIRDLRLEDALGAWPRFHSSIDFENLDLELVTSAFSFGRITGRLSGAIENLELFNWQPIAFDARLYTPPDDRSRHRISQRAVENIGSLGGGGAGITRALSSGVMRFFDEFRYDRLGLSCRLENELCHMDGVAPAPNGGYYLVKGSGLPRIDVIGSARRVDWPRLVQQLIAVTESQGPVVGAGGAGSN